ncbi:unnamed protein product [Kuraishia capsulata CBS 1993]|uniref:precorrin-2 dehydrogenase n=1 Tax=Kuraishia capsulata CBS 1993 TaxID=1382522 RepID=W6MJ99_9ASCO|nr:uncharacterized protein KUCA_T00002567001 [Kuraishia capsulata CBS 1993]CDK26594.1 unnamed protein product [Kuraishia capsulata CBS 1993]
MYKQRDLSHLKQKPELSEEDYELIRDVDQNETFALVLAAVDSPTVSSKIYADCKLRGLSVNIADRPPQCDFYFGSVLRKGSLQVMISTNGKSPRLANRIKITKLQPMLDQIDFARAVENLGFLREQVKQHKIQGSDLDTIKRRMEWNKTVTDIYSVEEWGQLTSNDVEKVLDYFPEFPPRSIEELRNG